MAIEVRRVAPNWRHPKKRGRYVPLFQVSRSTFEEMQREYAVTEADVMPFWTREQATAFQLFEDTSEGTPIGPVFRTRPAFVAWLVRETNLSPAAAEALIRHPVPTLSCIEGRAYCGLSAAEAKWGDPERAHLVRDPRD